MQVRLVADCGLCKIVQKHSDLGFLVGFEYFIHDPSLMSL